MKRLILVVIVATAMFAGNALAQGARNLPPRPTLTGPVADLVNNIVTAINKQDKAFIDKVLAPNATWADEDGHIFPATFFTNKLMMGMPRKLTTTNLAGETWDNAAWAAFDYVLDETTRDGSPNQIKGTETIVFRKMGNDWQVVLVHAGIDAKAIASH
jgi:ketosteroid isomerase-like protein